ncbi:MAG: hypothetical protein WBW78_15195 [Terrimicrobiaceae bacterium]
MSIERIARDYAAAPPRHLRIEAGRPVGTAEGFSTQVLGGELKNACVFVLPGEHTETAEAVLRRDPVWASPMLWRTLLPHYMTEPLRSGAVTPTLVGVILEEAEKLFLSREFPSPVKENMRFVFQSQCSAFIAPFLGLAEGLRVPLVTLDSEATRSFPEIAIWAADFASGNSPPGKP